MHGREIILLEVTQLVRSRAGTQEQSVSVRALTIAPPHLPVDAFRDTSRGWGTLSTAMAAKNLKLQPPGPYISGKLENEQTSMGRRTAAAKAPKILAMM